MVEEVKESAAVEEEKKEESKQLPKQIIIGIDLGTTNSVVAFYRTNADGSTAGEVI